MKVFALFTALALATHAPLAAATGSCAYYAMDFSGVTRGTYITDDFVSQPPCTTTDASHPDHASHPHDCLHRLYRKPVLA